MAESDQQEQRGDLHHPRRESREADEKIEKLNKRAAKIGVPRSP
jgi:hypothetical protein